MGEGVLTHLREKSEQRKARLEAFMQSEANSVAAGEQPTTLWDRIKEFFGRDSNDEELAQNNQDEPGLRSKVIANSPKSIKDKTLDENVASKKPVTNERKAKAIKVRASRNQREEQKLAKEYANPNSNSSSNNTLSNKLQQRGVKKFTDLLSLSTSNNINASKSAQVPLYQAADSTYKLNDYAPSSNDYLMLLQANLSGSTLMFNNAASAYAGGAGMGIAPTFEMPSFVDSAVKFAANARRAYSFLKTGNISPIGVFGTLVELEYNSAQTFADRANGIVFDVVNEYIISEHLPVISSALSAIGTRQHAFAHYLNENYRIICQDYRLRSEENWKNGEYKGRKNDKDTVRLDLYTSHFPYEYVGISIVYDYKFGIQGITQRQLNKIRQHGPVNAIVKEVRPSTKGGIKQIYPGVEK